VRQRSQRQRLDQSGWQRFEDLAWSTFTNPELSLEERLVGTQDQSYFALYVQGAAAFDRYLEAMMRLIVSYFGVRDTFDLAELDITAFFNTANVCWADILQSVTRYQLPTYNYVFRRQASMGYGTGLESFIGAPNEVAACLAGISRMAYEFNPTHSKHQQMTADQQLQIAMMEQAIVDIPGDIIITSKEALLNISQLACQEVCVVGLPCI
jgi:hypothetical protein